MSHRRRGLRDRCAPPPPRPPSSPRASAVLAAAAIGPDRIAAQLGGLGPAGPPRRRARRRRAAPRARGARRIGPSARRRRRAAGERVLVALSGGVDSAVAALRERERGAEVVAVTLKLWADSAHRREPRAAARRRPCSARAAVAHRLGIPHLTLDLRERVSRARSSAPSSTAIAAGVTPNPCVICNGDAAHRRDDRARRRASARRALATGHYARLADDGEGPLLAAPRPTRPRIRPTCSRACARTRSRGCASRSPS